MWSTTFDTYICNLDRIGMGHQFLADRADSMGGSLVFAGGRWCIVVPASRRESLVVVEDSCDNQRITLINDSTGEPIAEADLEPDEDLAEIVSYTPNELIVIVNRRHAVDYLEAFQEFLSGNPTWGQLGEGVMEAQVVTASSHFPELRFGTPSRAAAFDEWYEEVYAGLLPETSETVRTYRIDKAEKALEVVAQRLFKESDPEQLVNNGEEALPRRLAKSSDFYYTTQANGKEFTLRKYKKAARRLR
jgi:hypothetical protein